MKMLANVVEHETVRNLRPKENLLNQKQPEPERS